MNALTTTVLNFVIKDSIYTLFILAAANSSLDELFVVLVVLVELDVVVLVAAESVVVLVVVELVVFVELSVVVVLSEVVVLCEASSANRVEIESCYATNTLSIKARLLSKLLLRLCFSLNELKSTLPFSIS